MRRRINYIKSRYYTFWESLVSDVPSKNLSILTDFLLNLLYLALYFSTRIKHLGKIQYPYRDLPFTKYSLELKFGLKVKVIIRLLISNVERMKGPEM